MATYAEQLGLTPEEVQQLMDERKQGSQEPGKIEQAVQSPGDKFELAQPETPKGFFPTLQRGLRDIAAYPAKKVAESGLPGAGIVSGLMPSTPSGYGALGASFIGGPQAGLLTRALLAGGGATVGALAGGEEAPIEKGVVTGIATPLAEVTLGKGIDWMQRLARSSIRRLPDTLNLLDAIQRYIPNMPEGLRGSKLYQYFTGQGAQRDLSKMYQQVSDRIVDTAGGNTIHDPVITGILAQYLPESLPAATSWVGKYATARGAQNPQIAQMAQTHTGITIGDAMNAASKVFEKIKEIDPRNPLDRSVSFGEAMQAYRLLKDRIGVALGDSGHPELANAYMQMGQRYAQGKALLHVMTDKVFHKPSTGDPQINWEALGDAVNKNVKALESMPDFITHAMRGRGLGTGSAPVRIPFYSRIGHAGLHMPGAIPDPNVPIPFPVQKLFGRVTAGAVPGALEPPADQGEEQ